MLSMTGFGRGEASTEHYKLEIEIKSVNHRYLDINVRLPKALNFLDTTVRNYIKSYAARGKIDVFIYLENLQSQKEIVTYNHDIAEAYITGIRKISEDFELPFQLDAYQLSRFPDVFCAEEQEFDEEELTELLNRAIAVAANAFVESRRIEGEKLKCDLLDKIHSIGRLIEQIAERSPQMLEEYRQRITDKVQELLGDGHIDENILATEMVIYADKICVDEEMVRLRTHIEHIEETLMLDESVGRKLDFLTQEMNRESNTILSKSNDIKISDIGIDLKTIIEKIREQIQNIE